MADWNFYFVLETNCNLCTAALSDSASIHTIVPLLVCNRNYFLGV